MTDKTIEIKCSTADRLDIDDILPLQGELKVLSEGNFKKLKDSIIQHGFLFPFFIWKDGDLNYTCDGHQRHIVLQRMKAEGIQLIHKIYTNLYKSFLFS